MEEEKKETGEEVTPEGATTPEEEIKEPERFEETPEAKHARLKRQIEQHEKKYNLRPAEEPKPRKSGNKGDLDYGMKAFLTANGIKGADELSLVKEAMSATGKDLEDVIESRFFQAELKELREAKAVKDATPSGTKRSTTSARDSVEYWIAKGELPPMEDFELRKKVVNAKIQKATVKDVFSKHPIIK